MRKCSINYCNLNLNTPHKISESYTPDQQIDPKHLLSDECVRDLYKLIEEVNLYIDGERAPNKTVFYCLTKKSKEMIYMSKLLNETKVLLTNVRLSYPNLFEPRGFEGQEPKYSEPHYSKGR